MIESGGEFDNIGTGVLNGKNKTVSEFGDLFDVNHPRYQAAMRKALERYGRMESCTFFGSLNGTLYADFLWKYRFVKPTGSAELPDQTVELLYRVRVIHPEQKPVIIKADFLR